MGSRKRWSHRTCKSGDPARPNVTGVAEGVTKAGDFPVSASTAPSLVTQIRKRLKDE